MDLIINKENSSHLCYLGNTPAFLSQGNVKEHLRRPGKGRDFSGSFKEPRYNRKTQKPDVQVLERGSEHLVPGSVTSSCSTSRQERGRQQRCSPCLAWAAGGWSRPPAGTGTVRTNHVLCSYDPSSLLFTLGLIASVFRPGPGQIPTYCVLHFPPKPTCIQAAMSAPASFTTGSVGRALCQEQKNFLHLSCCWFHQ